MKKVRIKTGGFFYGGRTPVAGEELEVSNEAAESWEQNGMAEILGDAGEAEERRDAPKRKAENTGPSETTVAGPSETASARLPGRGKAR